MTQFLLAPRWLAWHLLLVVVLVSFTWLGHWQVAAFSRDDEPAGARPRAEVALDRLSAPGGRLAVADLGRRVQTSGTYDGARTLLVPGRERPGGGRVGLLVVTPLRTAAGVLPVVRGWVPTATAAAVRAPAGPVQVSGLLAGSEDGAAPGAAAVAGDGQLPYVATVTLLDAWPYRPGQLYDGYLALRAEVPAARPTPVPADVAAMDSGARSPAEVGRWRNLGYGLQWWVFAGAAAFLWWTVLRRAMQEQRDRAPEPAPPSLAAPRRTT